MSADRGWAPEHPAPGLTIWQPRRGFRYSFDAYCLAGWALEGGVPERALDVGTGSGVIAMLLSRAGVSRVEAVDVQPEWVAMARRSIRDSGLSVEVIEGDIRTLGGPSRPLVVCNPPYWSPGDGPVSPDPLRAAARHELNGTLAELIAGMARVGGRLALVLPQRREGEATAALAREGRPLRRRCRLGRRLVLLEGRPEPGPVAEESCGLDDDLSQVPAIRRWYARLGVPLRANPSRSGPPRKS